jgi:hypothetical protein
LGEKYRITYEIRASDLISPHENMSIAQQLVSGQVCMEKWEVDRRAR